MINLDTPIPTLRDWDACRSWCLSLAVLGLWRSARVEIRRRGLGSIEAQLGIRLRIAHDLEQIRQRGFPIDCSFRSLRC
jgi:hypothetical protein